MMSTTVRPSHRLATLLRRKGAGGPAYLLRDEFNTAAAGPLASPRTCEPGPGTLTLVQTDGQFSVSGDQLNFPAQATPVWGDQGFYSAAGLSVVSGRTLTWTLNFSTIGPTTAGTILGWHESATANVTTVNARPKFQANSGTSLSVTTSAAQWSVGAIATGTDYQVAEVLRSSGNFILIRGGAFANWTLVWVHNAGPAATLYPIFSNYNGAGVLDSFRVTDLPAPWNSDYGIATTRLAGSVAAGTAFTHTADGIVEFTVTMLGTALTNEIEFRRQDATNNWTVVVHSNGGALQLYEQVAGVYAQRANAAAGVTDGTRVVVVFDGTTIRGYSNNVLRWTYPSAMNFQTASSGKLTLLSNTGVVSDLIAWPRYPSFPSV